MTTSSDDQRTAAAAGTKAQHEWNPGEPLESCEEKLLAHVKAGTPLDLVGDGPVDHQAMTKWGQSHTVRAAVLRHLLVESKWPVHTKGVRMRGVRISGPLELESTTVRYSLLLGDCYLEDPVVLDYAAVPRLSLYRCRVARHLTAVRLVVTQEVELGESAFEGAVRLRDADITGRLDCRGAQFQANPAGDAMIADSIKVGGGVFLERALIAGAVRLSDAEITGRLDCRGAQFQTNPAGDAMIADEIKVGSGVFLDEISAAGAVRLSDADITGPLTCRGAQFQANPAGEALVADEIKVGSGVFLNRALIAGAVRLSDADITGRLDCRGAQFQANPAGDALIADSIKVGGGVFLDEISAAGAVRLSDADITGPLTCRGAKLETNLAGHALIADSIKVGGDVFLDQGFTAVGSVDLPGAHVNGFLTLVGARLADTVALRASDAQVENAFFWAPSLPVRGFVDLERVSVQHLVDDWSLPDGHWPPEGNLRLDGFIYDGLRGQHQATWRQRLDWIRRSHTTATFAVQPYEQLERVYRQSGQYAEAARIRTSRFEDPRRYGSLTRTARAGNLLFGKLFGYGYQPMRAVGWLLAVYAAVLLMVWGAQNHSNVFVPAKETKNITPAPTALHCSAGYPCFYPAGYAIDVVVPIINVRQAENWRPNGEVPWGWAYIAGGWVATGLGWAFSTIAVVAYTGLVRKD